MCDRLRTEHWVRFWKMRLSEQINIYSMSMFERIRLFSCVNYTSFKYVDILYGRRFYMIITIAPYTQKNCSTLACSIFILQSRTKKKSQRMVWSKYQLSADTHKRCYTWKRRVFLDTLHTKKSEFKFQIGWVLDWNDVCFNASDLSLCIKHK